MCYCTYMYVCMCIHIYIYVVTIFPWIKAQAFISFPVSKTRCLNVGGFYLRPGVYFQHFSFAPSVYFNFYMLIDCNDERGHSWLLSLIISEYHTYKTILTLFIIDLNSLSTASSYQEWFWIKAWASKRDQAFIFYNAQIPQLIIETGIYSEDAFTWGNMVYT